MIYTAGELKLSLGGFAKINDAVNKGKYHKLSHGLYTDESPFLSEPENIFARYPNAILTLESAFEYYDMFDYISGCYVVATPLKSHRIRNQKVRQFYMSKNILDIGKTTIKTEYGYINIYDKERLLIELFRLKSKISYEHYKEVVRSYRKLAQRGELNYNKISDYCMKFSNGERLLEQIQEIIL